MGKLARLARLAEETAGSAYDYGNGELLKWAVRTIRKHKEILTMETKTQGHGTIGWAVSALKHGHKLSRANWNGKNLYLVYAPPHSIQLAQKFGGGYNTTAAVFMKTAQDELVPWLCSQTDLLADDWEMVDATQPGETHATAA